MAVLASVRRVTVGEAEERLIVPLALSVPAGAFTRALLVKPGWGAFAMTSVLPVTLALKPVLAEAGQGGGTPFERDAVVVLRRVADAVADVRAVEAGNARAFLDLLARVIHATEGEEGPEATTSPDPPRLILP